MYSINTVIFNIKTSDVIEGRIFNSMGSKRLVPFYFFFFVISSGPGYDGRGRRT